MRQAYVPFVVFFFAALAHASDQVGTLTQLSGKVTILSSPSKTLPADAREGSARVKFGDEYFYSALAKLGDKVEKGAYIRTDLGATARIVFENGDQYNVGPGTAFRVDWKKDAAVAKDAAPQVSMQFGKLRGIVEKGGPRSKLLIRTKSATMGVRGTDFFIASGGSDNGTEVSILRGAVEVTPRSQVEARTLRVEAGNSVAITPPPAPASATAGKARDAASDAKSPSPSPEQNREPAIELRKTTQEELFQIQKTTGLEVARKEDLLGRFKDPKLAETVIRLESKARDTTLQDIKAHDPRLFAELDEAKIASSDELNRAAVKHLLKDAPKAPAKRKPYKSELESLDGSAYEQYFEPAQEKR